MDVALALNDIQPAMEGMTDMQKRTIILTITKTPRAKWDAWIREKLKLQDSYWNNMWDD